jgi:tellurite resistance protein
MDFNFADRGSTDFDSQTYIQILIAIAKADKDNGPREFDYVRQKARRLGVDYDRFLASTGKTFDLNKQRVSRPTALEILKDAIIIASMDRNFSLPEREKVYTFAGKLDISRNDVDYLEQCLKEYQALSQKWDRLVAGNY